MSNWVDKVWERYSSHGWRYRNNDNSVIVYLCDNGVCLLFIHPYDRISIHFDTVEEAKQAIVEALS